MCVNKNISTMYITATAIVSCLLWQNIGRIVTEVTKAPNLAEIFFRTYWWAQQNRHHIKIKGAFKIYLLLRIGGGLQFSCKTANKKRCSDVYRLKLYSSHSFINYMDVYIPFLCLYHTEISATMKSRICLQMLFRI